MTARWIEAVTGSLEQKKRYKRYREGVETLPEPYLTTAKAVDRYLMQAGGVTDGETFVRMLEDLLDIWQRAVADGTPVREIVGDDPVEFVDTFRSAYAGKDWTEKERARLRKAVDEAGIAEGERPEEAGS